MQILCKYINHTNIFAIFFSLTTLLGHLQAPGVEGAASPAERGAEVSTTAQQQAAAAKRPDLSAL